MRSTARCPLVFHTCASRLPRYLRRDRAKERGTESRVEEKQKERRREKGGRRQPEAKIIGRAQERLGLRVRQSQPRAWPVASSLNSLRRRSLVSWQTVTSQTRWLRQQEHLHLTVSLTVPLQQWKHQVIPVTLPSTGLTLIQMLMQPV